MKYPAATPQNENGFIPLVIDTREIVKRHMKDPNHKISEEEISQVTISTDHIDIAQHPLIKALKESGR